MGASIAPSWATRPEDSWPGTPTTLSRHCFRAPDRLGAFERHLEETRGHVARLERIADELNVSLRGRTCEGLEGLVAEGKDVMSHVDEQARDAGLVGTAQKVEHYEIAAHRTARTPAHRLGFSRVAKLLQQTLDEEAGTDQKLTSLAGSMVNAEALQDA